MRTNDLMLQEAHGPAGSAAAAAGPGARAVLTVVVTPGPVVDPAWLDDDPGAVRQRVVLPCSGADDPLAGLRALLLAVLPRLAPALRQLHAAEIRTLLPECEPAPGALSLDEVALPASERRLSRESERMFRLVNGLAALLGGAVQAEGGLQILVPDLLRADRLSLHLLHQLRRYAHPGLALAAGIAQADLDALAWLPVAGELEDIGLLRRRFVRDLLSLGRHALRQRPACAPAAAVAPMHAAGGVADIPRLLEWGEYEQALRALDGRQAADFATCKARGLAHAYLGQFTLAAHSYAQAAGAATDAVERAQAHVFQALLASKRKGEQALAQQLIARGRRCLEGVAGDAALIEHGWLSNVDALTRFSSGRYAEAMALCKDAYAGLRRCRGSDALHLKINLVSNLSVVFESMGRPADALAVWQNFEQFLQGGAAPLFAKIYHYRVAGLQWRAGQPAAAEAAYHRSYEEAACIGDRFHQGYIAFDIALLAAQRGDRTGAGAWLDLAAGHARAVADHDRAASVDALRDDLGNGDVAARQTLPAALRLPPGSKLGRPFHLAHIPPLPGMAAPAMERAS